MRILSEKIGIIDKKAKYLLFLVILSTFLLLFLYHKDVWRPVRYWLFLNGLILFIIPLISLVFLDKKRKLWLQVFSGTVIACILIFITKVSATTRIYSIIKRPQYIILLSSVFIIITVLILLIGKVNLKTYGFSFGKIRFWVPITVIFIVCMIPLIYWASGLEAFQKTYPMLPLAKKGITGFILAELSFALFFIFWEYFFRGYMLFTIEKRTGFLIANVIQAMAFAFMHLGKPELEVYSSLAGGLIIGWLAWRSKSFLPAFFVHWGIQATMDFFAVIK